MPIQANARSMSPANVTLSAIELAPDLIARLNRQGPRYTSYPTADRFSAQFGAGDYLQAVNSVRALGARHPLSLYLHVPFCDTVCYYCGCNKIVTSNHGKADTYLRYLKREIDIQGRLFAGMNYVEQLHIGGGTPTYFDDAQLTELMSHCRRWFHFADDQVGEYGIEIDPRTVSRARIAVLRSLGFNRISLGVQDIDPEVQRAVNRVQPLEMTIDAVEAAREAGFRSISIDLIYGLPKQSPATMAKTLDAVIALNPGRLSVYSYAHLPELFKMQRRIRTEDLPAPQARLEMLSLCIERLCEAGYVYIGMDHFARPDDDLAVAQRQGRLHRNFQGYSTHADAEMVSFGMSAISAVGSTFSQNEKTLDAYYERLDRGELPIARGIRLTLDDVLRRLIIQTLMCHFEVSVRALELAYPIQFGRYFATEIAALRSLQEDGLVVVDDDWIAVTPAGRLLIRNICMVFDRYMQQGAGQAASPAAQQAADAPVHRLRYWATI